MALTLIANTGVHLFTRKLEIDTQDKFRLWFHEWYDKTNGQWILDLAHEIDTDTNRYFYKKKDLYDNGYLSESVEDPNTFVSLLEEDGIRPLQIDDQPLTDGDIYKITFSDKNFILKEFENRWLPLPYYFRRSETKFKEGAFNWARMKLVHTPESTETKKVYNVILAFDTRASFEGNRYNEYPIFPDEFRSEMKFELCDHQFMLMDFCSPQPEHDYINNYLFSLVHPELRSVSHIKTGKRLNYIASYFYLIDYLATKKLLPEVILYKDNDVEYKDVDMVVDIGNSRTTALVLEDNFTFNNINQLELIDYTELLKPGADGATIVTYKEPFDMRLAFRKVDFGEFGINGSRQFVYPSFVRLGKEASTLIHKASEGEAQNERLTTHSSPKRYLWDGRRNKEEWKFLVLEGEADSHILNLPGISENLSSDGSIIDRNRTGGQSYHYSRRSLMTFAFLEMLAQAQTQINSHRYRTDRGDIAMPRKIRRMIVTCPTAMSKVERDALVRCASDAVQLLNRFHNRDNKVDIVPGVPSFRDTETRWYYDEAMCSQLVYVYGEVGDKYKGSCQEFFNLYGKKRDGSSENSLVIGSIDIGAGTSDLMISKYTYKKGDVTTITPDPLFYDSFYYAGDDMMNELVKNLMFFSQDSAFRTKLSYDSEETYRQKLRNFFGPDYAGQTVADRKNRRDFAIQYTVPLMYHMLDLLSKDAKDCVVRYKDVFRDSEPNTTVKQGFRKFFGFDLENLEWKYNRKEISEIISKAFEPILKKVATIMYAYDCDIVLLSGRPASLSPIRDIFLKYYTVSPNRLILLNNYFVGHWYPFSNNTGYISNPKTIVAMGALIGYYATTLANLDRFLIDKSKLDSNLHSVINYIEASREGQPIDYFITPDKNMGDLMISTLPTYLNIRQIGLDSYPCRSLYTIDFNRFKIGDRFRRKAAEDGVVLTDAQVLAKVKEYVDDLRLRMPFSLTVERDPEDKENLTIVTITDRDGNDLADNNIEINIQSLGTDDQYWLDNGAFDIK